MFTKLYDWMKQQAGHRHADKVLGVLAFAESSIFPIPPDVLLAPMVLARPDQWRRLGLICAISSIAGSILGYAIGYFFSGAALWILKLFHHPEFLDYFKMMFQKYGILIILVQGIIPVPYKLTTIASGLAHINIFLLLAASAVTRTTRFVGVAWLTQKFGAEMVAMVQKRIYLFGTLVVVAVLALVIAWNLLKR